MSSDRDLRLAALFRELHEEERIPSFEQVLTRRRRPSHARVWLTALASAALVAVLSFSLVRQQRERRALDFARELGQWTAASDVLLESPGSRALFKGVGGESLLDAADDMIRWRN